MEENLKSTDLQLSPIKEEFLETSTNKPVVRLIFRTAAEYEQKFDKDLALFDLDEVLEYLKGIGSVSSTTLCGYVSIIRSYVKKYKKQYPIESDSWKEVRSKQIRQCVTPTALQEKYVTEEALNEVLNEMPNPCDRYLVRAFYEGLKGGFYEDVWKIELRDFRYNPSATGNCAEDAYLLKVPSDGRIVKISWRLYRYAEESANNYHYTIGRPGVDGGVTEINLNDNCPYIFKCRDNTDDWNDEIKSKARIAKRMAALKRTYGVEWLTVPRLSTSGLVVAVKKLAQRKGISETEALKDEGFKEIRNQYSITASVAAIKDRLAPYFES